MQVDRALANPGSAGDVVNGDLAVAEREQELARGVENALLAADDRLR
jgi:hypothetical protein